MNNAFSNTFNEYVAEPDVYLSIKGVAPEIGYRLPGFSDLGINSEKLVTAVRDAGNPLTQEWSLKLIEYGDEMMHLGMQSDKKIGSKQKLESIFLEASFWYFLARYPFIMNDAAKKAYELHNQAYLQAKRFSIFPMEIVAIESQGKIGRAFLHFPNTTQKKCPLVLLSGGIDTWKSDFELHHLSEIFLKSGMAVLMLDIPGTGECPISASPSAHVWYASAIEQIKQHPKIDVGAIAFYGLSFGGYWATKLAFIEPELVGIINNGGPLHYTFQPEWLNHKPIGLKLALQHMLGLEDDVDQALEKMPLFSLLRDKHFQQEKYAPILNINGKKDVVVTPKEIDFLQEHGINQDVLLFGNDRHVASRNWDLHGTFASEWLSKKIN